jgi:hypothetical protein
MAEKREYSMSVSFTQKALLGAAALGALLATAAPAQAARWDDCRQRIHSAHHRLELAIANFGNDSREARHRQREYNDVRQWCWERYRGWWDDRHDRWRSDRWESQDD